MSTQFTISAPNGATITVYDHPAPRGSRPGDPVLVLAHGWVLSAATWDKVIALVQAQRNVRVVSYDQPGHSASTPGTVTKPTIDALGDVLHAVIRAADPQGPVVLAGHSMGGMTIMAFAGRYPDLIGSQVRAVGLVATAARIDANKEVPGAKAFMTVLSRMPAWVRTVPLPPHFVALGFGEGADPADVKEVANIQARTAPRSIGQYYFALMEMDQRASLPTLSKVPTRVIVGSKDHATPAKWGKAMAEQIGVEAQVLPELGHMLTYEAPEAVADLLIDLLDGVRA